MTQIVTNIIRKSRSDTKWHSGFGFRNLLFARNYSQLFAAAWVSLKANV